MSEKSDHVILICTTCKGELSAEAIQTALADKLPVGFAVRTVDCMAGCARPITVGFQAVGKAQYLFGDIRTQRDIDALATFAHQYQQSVDGWTSATDRPRALYTKTLSRMPRLEFGGRP